MTYALSVFALILFTSIALWLLYLIALNTKAPFIPIPKDLLADIFNALDIKSGDQVLELGCGDARFLVYSAIRCPGANFLGIEKNFFPFWVASWRTRHLTNVEIKRENFFGSDLSKRNKIYVYLFPQVLDELLPQLKKQLPSGATLVSGDFRFSEMPAQRTLLIDETRTLGKKLYIYKF